MRSAASRRQTPSIHAVDDELRDHAGRNRHQHVVTAVAHPVVAAGRLVQAVATPVVHHVARGTVLRWQARALDPVVLRARAAVVAVAGRRWPVAGVRLRTMGPAVAVPAGRRPGLVAVLLGVGCVMVAAAYSNLIDRPTTNTPRTQNEEQISKRSSRRALLLQCPHTHTDTTPQMPIIPSQSTTSSTPYNK